MENIRLTPYEIKAIKETAKEVFGEEVKLWLFGSRLDITKRGGDIDLYIETEEGYNVKKLLEFLAKLYLRIGERKIDVILEKEGCTKEIAVEAKSRGVRLC
jgi:predicted nucleotidyltransferase